MKQQFEIFISFSSIDRPRARELAVELKHSGFQVWFDEWFISIGSNIPLEIQNGIENSRSVLMLMTPEYFASEWAKLESTALIYQDPTNSSKSILPVLIRDCVPPKNIQALRHFDLREYSNSTLDLLISELCRVLEAEPRQRVSIKEKVVKELSEEVAKRKATEIEDAYLTIIETTAGIQNCALLFFDIDGFTLINAKFGSDDSERILKEIHVILARGLNDRAIVRRWKADEFIVVVPGMTEHAAFSLATKKISQIGAHDWKSICDGLYVTISCGIAIRLDYSEIPQSVLDVEWIERAILGMYSAKARGGRQARVGKSQTSKTREQLKSMLNPVSYLERFGS